MAVVQISRIQVRRGQKNTGTGIPQLASGEFGWAVDSQELYIGNGSVSEGAPAVGNTQILTENSDIFSIIGETYEYKANDQGVLTGKDGNHPVKRTLQSRLDDQVNGANFAILPGEDVTRELQNAILQLFPVDLSNSNIPSRVTLIINPGEYTLTDTIYIPSNCKIVGSGKGKTIFNSSVDPAFQVVNSYDGSSGANVSIDWTAGAANKTNVVGEGLATTSVSNQPKNIELSDFTINNSLQDATIILAEAMKESKFTNIAMSTAWVTSDALNPLKAGIEMTAFNNTTTANNEIVGCDFNNMTYAIKCNYDVVDTLIDDCKFDTLGRGIVFGEVILNVDGSTDGPSRSKISNNRFTNIMREAIWIEKGQQNYMDFNYYAGCGNDGASETTQQYSVIKLTDFNNQSTGEWFDRSKVSEDMVTYAGDFYKAEVAGPGIHTQRRVHNKLVIENLSTTTKVELIRLPGEADRKVKIDYIYKSKAGDIQRSGTLNVNINATQTNAQLTDDFDIRGNDAFDATNLPKLRFYSKYDAASDTAFVTYTNQFDERQGSTYDGADFSYKLTYVN